MVDTIASIPGHIACLTPLLASRQPKLAVSAYSGGVFAGGILSGIVVALGMQKITQWVVDHVDAINYPGPVFLSIQGLLGLLLVMVGIRLFRRRALPATASRPSAAWTPGFGPYHRRIRLRAGKHVHSFARRIALFRNH